MRFPEWLYRLLPGDQGSQQLGVIWRETSVTGAGAALGGTVYTVPNDKCLVLTNATLRTVTAAGEVSARRRILADPPAGSTRYDILDNELNGAANSSNTENWQGEVVVPGGWRVRVEGQMAPGVAVNEIGGEIHGYLIPRGTFVFG